MRSRLHSFFKIDTQFDELFWALAIVASLWVLQFLTDGQFHWRMP